MDDLKTVPYVVYEASEARAERNIKRLIWALVLSILICFLTNLAWLWLWNQYDYVSTEDTRTYVQDGAGLNIIGNGNEVNDESAANDQP